MAPDFRVRRLVETAHRDSGRFAAGRVPEQEGAAGLAEAAADFFRRLIPADMLLAAHGQCFAGHVDRGPVMAGLLATLGAVAGIGLGQRAGDFNLDGAAEAGAVVDCAGHLSHPCFWS